MKILVKRRQIQRKNEKDELLFRIVCIKMEKCIRRKRIL